MAYRIANSATTLTSTTGWDTVTNTPTLFDKLAGLTIWYQGKPSPIITQLSLGGIAPAVWGVSTSALTTPGTTGKVLKDTLSTPKFIALK